MRAKSARPKVGQGDKSKKCSFYLSTESLQRLSVHAAMDSCDRSSLVEQLIQDHLRRYDLPRRRVGSQSVEQVEDRQTETAA